MSVESAPGVDEQLVRQLAARARAEGLKVTGEASHHHPASAAALEPSPGAAVPASSSPEPADSRVRLLLHLARAMQDLDASIPDDLGDGNEVIELEANPAERARRREREKLDS